MPPSPLPWPLDKLKAKAEKNIAKNEAAAQQRSAGREPEKDRAGSTETSSTSAIPAGETAESSQKPKPRIETYSDSEDEEELRLKREAAAPDGAGEPADASNASLVKWMRKDTGSREGGPARQVQRVRIQWPWRLPLAEPLQLHDPAWSTQRVAHACRRTFQAHLRAVKEAPPWAWLLRILVIALFERFRPRLAARLELFCIGIPLCDGLGALLGQEAWALGLPGGLGRVTRQAALASWPALGALAYRGLRSWRAARRPRPRMKRTTSMCVAELAKDYEERESRRSSLQMPGMGPQGAATLVTGYAAELAELRRMLGSSGVRLPPGRFDQAGAELMRFAAAAGIEKAPGAEALAVALEEAAHRVIATVRWSRRQRFMPLAQLKQWKHVVELEGQDDEGYPLVLVHAAKACELRQGRLSEQAVQAIISMVEYVTQQVMEEGPVKDQMVVVLDCCDASTLHVTRKVSRIKGLVKALTQHYPNRLRRLDVVGLPGVLRWVYTSVRPMLASETASKIRMCEPGDPSLPLPLNKGLTTKNRTLSAPPRIYEDMAREAGGEGEGSLLQTQRRVKIPDKPVVLDNGLKHEPSPRDQLRRVPSILRSSRNRSRCRNSDSDRPLDPIPFPELSPRSPTAMSPSQKADLQVPVSSVLKCGMVFVVLTLMAAFMSHLQLREGIPGTTL